MRFVWMALGLGLMVCGCATAPSEPMDPSGAEDVDPVEIQLENDFRAMEMAIGRFFADYGYLPKSLDQLPRAEVPVAWGASDRPYLNEIPLDPWGRPYAYRMPGSGGRSYEIWSWGADGQVGGLGIAADRSNFAR